MNLLVNAQHALEETAGERRVRIAPSEEAQHVAVRLADNGPGIAPEVASRIFEPFFTTKPQELGTGIGLSVCRGIVDAHGGTLQAEVTPGAVRPSWCGCRGCRTSERAGAPAGTLAAVKHRTGDPCRRRRARYRGRDRRDRGSARRPVDVVESVAPRSTGSRATGTTS
jgi:hypothetical protein